METSGKVDVVSGSGAVFHIVSGSGAVFHFISVVFFCHKGLTEKEKNAET